MWTKKIQIKIHSLQCELIEFIHLQLNLLTQLTQLIILQPVPV